MLVLLSPHSHCGMRVSAPSHTGTHTCIHTYMRTQILNPHDNLGLTFLELVQQLLLKDAIVKEMLNSAMVMINKTDKIP